MKLRGWGNALAVAGLVLTVGTAVAQAPSPSPRVWIVLGISLVCALLAIAALRPKANEEDSRQLNFLRTKITDRDIEFLRVGAKAITFPQTLSEQSIALAPRGEKWQIETKEKADARAQRLMALGLMEPRGSSEVETSALGRSLLAFDEAIKIKRQAT